MTPLFLVLLPVSARALVERINKKNKNANVKPFMVKNHLWLFINCSIENPAFDSQASSAFIPLYCSTASTLVDSATIDAHD